MFYVTKPLEYPKYPKIIEQRIQPFNEKIWGNEKEQMTPTRTIQKSLTNIMLNKRSQKQKRLNTIGFHLYEVHKYAEPNYSVKNQHVSYL